MAECAKSLMNFTKNYKVFWRARALKIQIFKKLKGIFCTSRYKNKQRLAILYFRASYSRRYVQLEELKSLFLRKFDFRYNISFIDPPLRGFGEIFPSVMIFPSGLSSLQEIFHRIPLAAGI